MRNFRNDIDERYQNGPVDPLAFHEATSEIDLDPNKVVIPAPTDQNKQFSLRSFIERFLWSSETPKTPGEND